MISLGGKHLKHSDHHVNLLNAACLDGLCSKNRNMFFWFFGLFFFLHTIGFHVFYHQPHKDECICTPGLIYVG